MITHNIKWFLGLSAAVHAAALVAWLPPEHRPGNAGQPLLLAVTNHTGKAVQQPQSQAETPTQPFTDNILPPTPADPAPVAAATPVKPQGLERPAARQQIDPPVPSSAPAQVPDNRAGTAQAASSSTSREEHEQHLRACVMELITRQLSYPAIARRKGWQGVVRLELHIEPDGQISDLQIDQTSGYAVLDKAALQSLQLARIPEAAQWLDGETVDIIVPVEYRLIDG